MRTPASQYRKSARSTAFELSTVAPRVRLESRGVSFNFIAAETQ